MLLTPKAIISGWANDIISLSRPMLSSMRLSFLTVPKNKVTDRPLFLLKTKFQHSKTILLSRNDHDKIRTLVTSIYTFLDSWKITDINKTHSWNRTSSMKYLRTINHGDFRLHQRDNLLLFILLIHSHHLYLVVNALNPSLNTDIPSRICISTNGTCYHHTTKKRKKNLLYL
jgi:hypothetical protein